VRNKEEKQKKQEKIRVRYLSVVFVLLHGEDNHQSTCGKVKFASVCAEVANTDVYKSKLVTEKVI
jgi:hypothetical protein